MEKRNQQELITIMMAGYKFPVVICVLLALVGAGRAAAETTGCGPAFDHFQLTLEQGWRTESAGPFYYSEQTEDTTTWAIPPFYSCHHDTAVTAHEDDFLYPALTHIHYGQEHRWQIFQLFSFSGAQEQGDIKKDRVTIFPFYFQQPS